MISSSSKRLHSFFQYSLLLGLLLYVFRVIYTTRFTYAFLVWNVFLAWLPLFFAQIIQVLDKKSKKISFEIVGLLLLWLLFFPNAPYIITDFIHLHQYSGIMPLWYDTIMISWFTLVGLVMGLLSLSLVQEYVARRFGRSSGWGLVIVTLLLSSLAIYIGRFLRWNSWDFFLQPLDLFDDLLNLFVHPLADPSFLPTLAFTFIYQAGSYGIFSFMKKIGLFGTKNTKMNK